MTKQFGVYLISLSIIIASLALVIEKDYGADGPTGNVISNLIEQPEIELNSMDYVAGAAISLSSLMIVVGIVLYFRRGTG